MRGNRADLCTDLVALACRGGAIQALVLKAAQAHVVADDVQHAHHLAEYQHPAALVAPLSHTTSSFEAQAPHAPSLAARTAQQEQISSKNAAGNIAQDSKKPVHEGGLMV